jgi:hypothetical protein
MEPPLTPMLPEYPSEVTFSPQQAARIRQLVKFAACRVTARKQVKALRLQLIDVLSETIWTLEQRLALLTN